MFLNTQGEPLIRNCFKSVRAQICTQISLSQHYIIFEKKLYNAELFVGSSLVLEREPIVRELCSSGPESSLR